jgi:transcriptional regulator with PAS, ATPase and Fis domain
MIRGDVGDGTLTVAVDGRPLLVVRAVRLTVLRTPAGQEGLEVRVVTPTFVIGSGAGSDLVLADPAVSREHVQVTLMPNGVRLRDRSKNGTRIGGLRVADVLVQADTVITVGTSSIAIRLEADRLTLPLSDHVSFGEAFGAAPVMRHLFSVLEEAARTDIPILLEGESGVGKDVLARAIHGESPRSGGPFIVIDCGTIPANLIESELFGHVRGSFTGATDDRRGLFDEARGGTVFLDEVGELPIDMQPKLLRALEAREIRPVGARKPRSTDVRVVAATNRRLAEAVRRGEFREDLFYRLAVARVTVPSLRDRAEDVLPLATHFLRRALGDPGAEIPADLAAMLAEYSWPGNVRELRNVIERHAALGDSAVGLLIDSRAVASPSEDLSVLPYHEARRLVLERFEAEYVPRVLERANGVVARAAELAELARPSFYRLLERLRLADRPSER